jgi:arylsulfatase
MKKVLWGLVVVGLVGLGCGREAAPRWNVVFLLVDTLRADHLSAYGYERATSPVLEELAASSYLFEKNVSQAGCTFPSVNSILTSRSPYLFLFQPGRDWSIPEETPSMAEILGEHGYSTFAVSASTVVRKTPSVHNKVGGYDRGFEVFDEQCLDDDADCVNAKALEILDGLEEPFFGYLHYMEPHQPYQPPASFERRFSNGYKIGKPFIQRGEVGPIERMLYKDGPDLDLKPRDLRHLIALYDDEIAYFDQQLGVLLAQLKRRGLMERTLLVIASDHGEAFFEHGDIHHCRDLVYDTLVHTPLLLRVPSGSDGRRAGGRRFDALVQNLDILPTVLDLLAIDDRPYGLEGHSLRRVIEQGGRVNRYAFATQGVMRMVADERFKLILDLETGGLRLFDRSEDPLETTDLATELPEVVDRLQATLRDWLVHHEGEDAAGRGVRRATEVRKQLQALGYL